MSKEICISTTPHETRLAILEDEQLTEVYYERENEYTLAGSIYKGRVTRVLPGMQSAFVDVGLERDAFLYVTDFLEEQEDAADFERVSGNGRPEEQDAREVKEARSTQSAAPPEEGQPVRHSPAPREQFEDGTRRWRGRRGRRKGFRPAGSPDSVVTTGRSDTSAPPEPAQEEQPAGDRFTAGLQSLPGESISKYGGHGAAQPASPSAETYPLEPRPSRPTSKPSTLIDEPLRWTGGSVLPGESISRYRSETETGSPGQSGALPLPSAQAAHEPVESVFSAHSEAGPAASSHSSAGPSQPLEAGEEPIAGGAEFEPENASASYRVDPSAPSEFRFSSNVAEPGHPELDEELEGHEGSSRSATVPERDQTSNQQDVRSSQPSIASEEEEADEDEVDPSFEDEAGDLHDSAMGLMEEEEVSDEEEYDFTPFYAHAEDPDLEDLEEETLDQHIAAGAEVEEMVRDAHLDQRLNEEGSAAAVEEDTEEAPGEETSDDETDNELEETPAPGVEQPVRRDRDHRRGARGGRSDRRRHNGRRQAAQSSSLPVISELLKQGQEILVQIAKEPIAKKGARITSHIALPGRFLVFMPTVNHVGVSRKIASDEERQRLKRILVSERGTAGGGFIVRTAADGASEEELRADIRFLISLWDEIKQRSDAAKAPALIYHDLNLVERVLRDQVSDDFSTIWVDSESEYERIVRFLNRFQPSLVRRVKLYTKETPLFEQFGIQEEITKALRSKVWLKSGGSIVINQTEALVAIDINTGKYVGKTARLEDTILKTNLDAIPEIVRQIRLRDLGGIIVIDFIDMDERKNRNKVMQALEDALKADRAPSKVLQFNDFGLVAITRKRVKQSLERTLSTQCAICAGTGMVKSPATVCNEIYVEMRKMQRHLERHDVLLRVHPEVVKTLKANSSRWLNELEEMIGKTIIVKSDPALHPEQFDIH